jgi:DGQHR domain-containing protein
MGKAKKKEEKAKAPKPNYRYEAFRFAQREGALHLVTFHAPVCEVLKWADIDALSYKNVGPQRERKLARVRQIQRFMSSENVIPTAIVIGFNQGRTEFDESTSSDAGYGTLTVRSAGFAATVVDGQHRLYGMDEFRPDTKVPIVGLLDADDIEKAFQFLVINNKASKVSPAHAKALLAKMNEKELADRLRLARVSLDIDGARDVDLVNTEEDSPFRGRIDWPATRKADRLIQPTAIELSLDYINSLNVSEFEDRDVRRGVLLAIWKAVNDKWPKLWTRGNRLVEKVGIFCLTKFVIDMITSWADSDEIEIELTDLDEITKRTAKILMYMHQDFWVAPWSRNAPGGFDTSQGRQRVVDALTQMYRNVRRGVDWSADIEIIESPSQSKD